MENVNLRKAEQENNVNNAIDDVRCKCHYDGALAEIIGRRYRFQEKNSSLSEVLPNLRYTISYHNMEIHPMEKYASLINKEYSCVDDPIYRLCLEDCSATPGWVRLRCVDYPTERSTSGAGSTIYDKIDNDSDFSKFSDYESIKSGHGKKTNLHSTKSGEYKPGEPNSTIANRPPMKTPDHSSTSQSDEENDEVYPPSGIEFMRELENRIKGNGKLLMSVPMSETTGRSGSSLALERSTFTPTSSTLEVPKSSRLVSRSGQECRSSGDSTSDEYYDYSSVNYIPRELPKPLSASYNDSGVSCQRSSTMPLDCFKTIKVAVHDPKNDEFELERSYEHKTYLSSAKFFDFFASGFHDWSRRLDRKEQSLQEATTFKAAVCCSQIRTTSELKYRSNLEFVPVAHVPFWPDIAKEWETRRRPRVVDQRTNIGYVWPHPSKRKSIVEQGCELMTDGSRTQGHKSKHARLEWQLCFNVARDSLLNSLTEHHLKALFWARIIFRHVLQTTGVLSNQHLETVFLYIVESDYVNWPAAALGDRVRDIFGLLQECITNKKLPHYFVHKRNMLSTKAPRDLIKAQERIFRLNENFVGLTLQAARQIQTSDTTYPFPDLATLWEIIYSSTLTEKMATLKRPLSAPQIATDTSERKKKGKSQPQEGFWDAVAKQQTSVDQTQEILRRKRALMEAKKREKRAQSTGDLSDQDLKIGPFSQEQTIALFEFFIQHFIRVAEMSNRLGRYDKSYVVLDQALNLTWLLRDEVYHNRVDEYLTTIEALKDEVLQNFVFNTPYVSIPGLPTVFKTGISDHPSGMRLNPVKHSNSAISSTYSIGKLGTPLPETPLEQEARKKLTNGHIFEFEINNNPVNRASTYPKKSPESAPAIMITTAEINHISSPSSNNQEMPLRAIDPDTPGNMNSISSSEESESSDMEITDF